MRIDVNHAAGAATAAFAEALGVGITEIVKGQSEMLAPQYGVYGGTVEVWEVRTPAKAASISETLAPRGFLARVAVCADGLRVDDPNGWISLTRQGWWVGGSPSELTLTALWWVRSQQWEITCRNKWLINCGMPLPHEWEVEWERVLSEKRTEIRRWRAALRHHNRDVDKAWKAFSGK